MKEVKAQVLRQKDTTLYYFTMDARELEPFFGQLKEALRVRAPIS
ncbi:MAG: hypothetical protein QOH42_816 [Blastocatellia bacterium]|jgi:hypothetical protein|nr:hypothetical protein [Blastocatellia bacterium]